MTSSRALAPAVREDLISLDGPHLLGGRCKSCGHSHFPRRPICPDCQSEQVVSTALSSEGVIYSFTIVRMPAPGYHGPVPYAVGLVELPEKLRVATTLTAEELESLQIGRVARFELITLPGPGEGDELTSYAYRMEG